MNLMPLLNRKDAEVSDAEAYRNGMRRCTECQQDRCPRPVRNQSSPLLRWCGFFTERQAGGGNDYGRHYRPSPARAILDSLEVA